MEMNGEGGNQERKIATKKLRALEEGRLPTDCVFLVGRNDHSAQEVRAFKHDLQVCSECFDGFFNTFVTDTALIRLRNVEPNIFKLVVEFAYLSGQLVTEVSCLEECLHLAQAADEFMIDELSDLCVKILEENFLTVDNVRRVLNAWHHVTAVGLACLKLLSSSARECLNPKRFCEANEQALKLFLSLDNVNYKSEVEVFRACIAYVESTSRDKVCLPRHRALLLSEAGPLGELMPLLSEKDQHRVTMFTNKLTSLEAKQETGLCLKSEERRSRCQEFHLFPRLKMLDMLSVFREGRAEEIIDVSYLAGIWRSLYFKLSLKTKKCISILGFDLFSQVMNIKFEDYLSSTPFRRLMLGDTYKNNMCVAVRATSALGGELSPLVQCPATLTKNSWARFDTFVTLPKGGSLEITVSIYDIPYSYTGGMFLRKVGNLNQNSDHFSQVKVEMATVDIYKLFDNYSATDVGVFKSIYFEEV
ncbi:uncharacterized protein LOC135936975 [Cloeon dipterum]|uniref:uncharacterized protein LOC135936975 n=1 Tax=Cloeon dipterum TaxID=197152 RepID=UPI0032208A32